MTLLPVHITGGIVAIVAGFVALYALKGASVHRKAGLVFVYAMVVMASSGAMMAMIKLNRGNVMGGGLTLYAGEITVRASRRETARRARQQTAATEPAGRILEPEAAR